MTEEFNSEIIEYDFCGFENFRCWRDEARESRKVGGNRKLNDTYS